MSEHSYQVRPKSMTRLILMTIPLEEYEVDQIVYDLDKSIEVKTKRIYKLARSHERLRMELAGAMQLISDMEKEIADRASAFQCLRNELKQLREQAAERIELNTKESGKHGKE